MFQFLVFSIVAISANFAFALTCSSGEYLVLGHHRKGYVRSDGTFVKATNVKTHCRSRSRGYEYAIDKFKDGTSLNWPHKGESPRSWSEEDKERVIEALEGLPENLFVDSLSGIYRFKRSKDFPMELAPNGEIYWEGRKSGYIEEDGKLSHEEDYANNVEHFLYDPDNLKKVTLNAYDWIKKHFGGDFKLKGSKK